MEPLLKVENLVTGYRTEQGLVKAVDNISFEVNKGETVCIVGESGSGKSVTSLSIMRLVDFENGEIIDGSIHFQDKDLASLSNEDMRSIRGSKISMIFQEPMTALNPVFTIGKQIMETFYFHRSYSGKKAKQRAIELLELVGINQPEERLKQYPHELSGGMRQRVMIAIALGCEPDLLIADEPTTALDVTIEAQILELLKTIKQEMEMSILLITHDIGVAAEVSDRIIVMYAGKIVEVAPTIELFSQTLHPYTKGLLESVPKMSGERGVELPSIEGTLPGIHSMPIGCRFAPRCHYKTEKCVQVEPPLENHYGHLAACWHAEEVRNGTLEKGETT
ncbi:ABC transporter ATP-binding protein [Salipaludibacillus daqingensis]|uniref:ABC transporter ATP-binding protein n=1 Tax=Salipaludibacillus daqingensis TaxID=3041001 RepID=UPI002475EEA5|nr:ABC transporter ATP-binding protein [Salipaludibacillus daqingensis]